MCVCVSVASVCLCVYVSVCVCACKSVFPTLSVQGPGPHPPSFSIIFPSSLQPFRLFLSFCSIVYHKEMFLERVADRPKLVTVSRVFSLAAHDPLACNRLVNSAVRRRQWGANYFTLTRSRVARGRKKMARIWRWTPFGFDSFERFKAFEGARNNDSSHFLRTKLQSNRTDRLIPIVVSSVWFSLKFEIQISKGEISKGWKFKSLASTPQNLSLRFPRQSQSLKISQKA